MSDATPQPSPVPAAARQDAEVCRTVRVRDGLEVVFVVDPTFLVNGVTRVDPISQYIIETGRCGGGTVHDLMLDLLRPGQTVLDIGAHVGTFSLPAAALGCRVIALEANPRQAELLRASARRNGFEHLRAVHAAVADVSGRVAFGSCGPWGHVRKLTVEDDLPSVEVPAVAVDDLLAELGWQEVDLVKMDIEGSELQAVKGMRRLLAREDGPAILFESSAAGMEWYGQDTGQLLGVLEDLGYRSYLVDQVRPGRLLPVRPDDVQPECVSDYLALKRPPNGLPAPWHVTSALSRREMVDRLLVSCKDENWGYRRHPARVLRQAPRWLQDHSQIRAALRSLRDDPQPEVCAAAAWSAVLDERRPWLERIIQWCLGRAA